MTDRPPSSALVDTANDSAEAADDPASPSPVEVRIRIRVRYNECDPMSLAHHSTYPCWLEMARTEMVRQAGVRYRDLERRGFFFAVTALDLRYRSPAKYDDVIEVHAVVRKATRVKLEHEYEITRDGILLTTASTTVACIGTDGRPQMMPPEILELCGVSA